MPAVTGFLRYLSAWIGFVGLMALGNTISCFRGHQFLADRLYTGAPEQVNGLMARLFGAWTLLSTFVRLACAMDIKNKTLYHITFMSFLLAFGHFTSEAFLYKTAPITIGVMAPLVVSSISIIWMMFGYIYLSESTGFERPKKFNSDGVYIEKHRLLHQERIQNPKKGL